MDEYFFHPFIYHPLVNEHGLVITLVGWSPNNILKTMHRTHWPLQLNNFIHFGVYDHTCILNFNFDFGIIYEFCWKFITCIEFELFDFCVINFLEILALWENMQTIFGDNSFGGPKDIFPIFELISINFGKFHFFCIWRWIQVSSLPIQFFNGRPCVWGVSTCLESKVLELQIWCVNNY